MGYGYDKEGIIIGHAKPISKAEIMELFENEESMCRLFSQSEMEGSIKGTGFFLKINNKDIPFNKCLITNNHILNENYIKNQNRIEIIYKNETKFIPINENRKVFTDEKLDYTIIEILDEDNIEHFFEIAQNINGIKDEDIFILQYLDSNELLFSSGKVVSIEGDTIKHTCPTSKGSSGSPILLRYFNYNIIGLHYGGEKKRNYNFSTNINSIIDDIIKKKKSIRIIIGEIFIGKEDINKEIRIINSYDESFRERKFKIII